MDATFWIGLGLGTILSYAASIIANRTDSLVVGFLSKIRVKSANRRREKQQKKIDFARMLLENPSYCSVYVAHETCYAIVMTILGVMSATFMAICFVSLEMIDRVSEKGVVTSKMTINLLSPEHLTFKIVILASYFFILLGSTSYLKLGFLKLRMRGIVKSDREIISQSTPT